MDDRATSARVARTEALERLVDGLGDWSRGDGPLYRSLARALAAMVERAELAAGDRLPSERALAGAVAVSRGVAVAAYDELVADGVVARRQGSGTFVARQVDQLPAGREGSALVGQLVAPGAALLIDLSISVLHDAADLPAVAVSTTEMGTAAADSPWGLPELRVRIAQRLGALGLPTVAEQVLVTTGAQQGISVAIGCWVRPGEVVVVDDPTYPGVLSALAAAGAVARPVPVDRHGPVLRELEVALDDAPALVYLQSGVHSPTGARLSAHRRSTIAGWLQDRRTPLVEDLALHPLDWSGAPPAAPLAAHIPDHPVALVGSYSKRFWAGLRVGFVRAPAPVAQRLVRVKATHDLGSSAVGQAMALALLDHPGHDRAIERRNQVLAHRAEHLVAELHRALPSWRTSVPDGGLSVWVRLPEPVAATFQAVALRHGVAVATAEGLSARPAQHRDRIRLTFAVPERVLTEAARRLGAAWLELHG